MNTCRVWPLPSQSTQTAGVTRKPTAATHWLVGPSRVNKRPVAGISWRPRSENQQYNRVDSC